jgi:hypothetical protein
VTLLAAGLAAGCASGPRVTPGREVVVREKGYRVTPPAGWEVVSTDADVAVRQSALGAGLMAHATCEGRAPHRSLPVLARHLRFGLRDVEGLDQAPVEMAGQRGLRSRFTARLDGVPVAVGAITLAARGCAYDLVVVAPPDGLPAVAAAFDAFAASFALVDGVR